MRSNGNSRYVTQFELSSAKFPSRILYKSNKPVKRYLLMTSKKHGIRQGMHKSDQRQTKYNINHQNQAE